MASHERAAFFLRLLTALKRGMLGKSAHPHMKQFTGGEEYWDRAIAAQLGWLRKQPTPADRRAVGH